MGREKPLIVVTGSRRGSRSAWQASRILLAIHGAKSRFVYPGDWDVQSAMDGLLLLGGVDIDPAFYGGSDHDAIVRTEPARDHMELALLQRTQKENLPIMGICRGMQMINLTYGGTLLPHIGDLDLEMPHTKSLLPMKWIKVLHDTKLYTILKNPNVKVNALHHQAVEILGEGLQKAAYDHNGIIQAIEHKHAPFVLGVQWHPEFMPYMWHTHKLFNAFVKAAKRYYSPNEYSEILREREEVSCEHNNVKSHP
jgi:putative glutamine amidotransferase